MSDGGETCGKASDGAVADLFQYSELADGGAGEELVRAKSDPQLPLCSQDADEDGIPRLEHNVREQDEHAASEPATGPEYEEPKREGTAASDEGALHAPSVGASPLGPAAPQQQHLSQHSRERSRGLDGGRRSSRQRSASVTEPPPAYYRNGFPRGGAPPPPRPGAFPRVSSKSNLRDAAKGPKGAPGLSKSAASRLRPPEPATAMRALPELATSDEKARPGGKRPFPPMPVVRKNPKDIKEAVRRWYRIDKRGHMTIVNADKYELMVQLGVHTRDLRVLDPSLTSSYPSCILSREHALVVNLEFVQVIITTDTTIVLNAENDKVHPFVLELQRRLSSDTNMMNGEEDLRDERQAAMEQLDADASQEVSYELKVLEVCLDTIANHMGALVTDLEGSAYPALDALTNRVNASNLERVRRVKNRMVRLNTRVETIRAVLEKYLDDDEDMEDLNLTGKLEVAKREQARMQAHMEKRAEAFARYEAKRSSKLDEDANASISSFSSSSGNSSAEDKSWLSEQVEHTLEPYFMSFDNTWNRIQNLAEYIDDTEDLINITLDSHRNQLIQIDLLLTAATFCAGLITTVGGIFGMNLYNGNNPGTGPAWVFDVVAIGSSVGAVLLLILFVLFIRWKGLAFV